MESEEREDIEDFNPSDEELEAMQELEEHFEWFGGADRL